MARLGRRKKTGGRQKGVSNKVNADMREIVLRKYKTTPLEYMMSVLNDSKSTKAEKMWAAEKAASYLHPKLVNQEVSGPGGSAQQHEHKLVVEFE